MSGSRGPKPGPHNDLEDPEGADQLSASSAVLSSLLLSASIAARPLCREPLHVWELSAVERIYLDDETSVILKTAAEPLTSEAGTLRHAGQHGVPVPEVLASSRVENRTLVMLLEDLGEPPKNDPPLPIGARAAVTVHACPPHPDLPVLDAEALAQLPYQALESLQILNQEKRWRGAHDVRDPLERIAEIAPQRAQGAVIPPFGMCHSEFHPTSLLNNGDDVVILDWARAFTGPGLLDLASWEDTPKPLDATAIATMLHSYVAAGGSPSALHPRGGRPPELWAGGWHRVWIVEWYIQQCARWIPDPARDEETQRIVRRHLREALTCLT